MQGHRREELEDYLFFHKIKDSHWTTTYSYVPKDIMQYAQDWVDRKEFPDAVIEIDMGEEFSDFKLHSIDELLEAEEIQFSTVIQLFEEYKRKKGL